MDLSGVTDSDLFEILTGFEILAEKKWNCEACIRTTDEATRRAVKGCVGGKHFSIRHSGREVFTVDRCLGNYYTPNIGLLYRAYQQFEKGVMPFEGPFLEQPARMIDMFGVFESLEAERQEAANKNAERKANRGR